MAEAKSKRPTRITGGAMAGFSILLVIAILVLIQLIVIRHDHTFDLTANKRFTLSDQSMKVLESLEEPVRAICFYNEEQDDYAKVRDLLMKYDAASDNFRYEFVDLDKAPLLAKKYGVNSYATTALVYGDQSRIVTDPTEQEFTNALIKLSRGNIKKKVVFLTLHGERDTESKEAAGLDKLKVGLSNANYDVKTLKLLEAGSVPEDCTVLVIAGPEQDLIPGELELLDAYIKRGGHMMILADPLVAPKFADWIQNYGVTADNDLIIDPDGLENPLQPIVTDYPPHEITKSMPYQTFYHIVRSITPVAPAPAGITTAVLARTSENAWGETDISSLDEFTPKFSADTDKPGPVSIAVAVEIGGKAPDGDSGENDKEKSSRLVIFGDSDFITNAFITSFPADGVFALNTIHWLADESDLISIPPRDPISQPIHPSPTQQILTFVISVIILPLFIVVTGIVRVIRRRKR